MSDCNCGELAPYDEAPMMHRILHVKCPVVKKIKKQMDHLSARMYLYRKDLEKSKTFWGRLKRYKTSVYYLPLVIAILAVCFYLGAYTGVKLCASTGCTACSCPASPFKFGFNLAKTPVF